VRRCIAVSGDAIVIREGVVLLNDRILDEPYLNPEQIDSTHLAPELDVWNNWGPFTVPQGSIFVMGNNRNADTDFDSRFDGVLDVRCAIGKVIYVL